VKKIGQVGMTSGSVHLRGAEHHNQTHASSKVRKTLDTTPKKHSSRMRFRSVVEKRRIVEEALEAGASVAKVARAHGVDAKQVLRGGTSIGICKIVNRGAERFNLARGM